MNVIGDICIFAQKTLIKVINIDLYRKNHCAFVMQVIFIVNY